MEEKERGWYMFWIFVLGILLAGTTAATFNLLTENMKLKSQVDDLNAQLLTLQTQYEDLEKKYSSAIEELRSALNKYSTCDLEKMNLEEDVYTLKGAFANYDKVVSALIWYNDVNSCTDYMANYITYRDALIQAKEFFLNNKKDIERLLGDETAREFGYKEGLDVISLITSINAFISTLDQTYQYCLGG